MIRENIEMVIIRLDIKTKKEITLSDIRKQNSPIFTLELLLSNELVNMPQIENKLFLTRRLSRHRKRVNNMRNERYLDN